jgi:pimeloyl-ACP methyl ester carboxylesterase
MTAGARDMRIAVPDEDVVLRARVAGDDAAPGVLLLHGLGEDLDVWWERGWTQALSRRSRVIAFDARGHGASSKPHEPGRYSTQARVADAMAVLDATGCEAADVVGYSMGGWTALLLAARAPERLRSIAVGGASAIGQSLASLRRALAGPLDALVATVEHQCGALPEAFRQRFLGNDPAALSAVCAEDRLALLDALVVLAAPAMFYIGERDPLRPAVEASARQLGWQCRVVDGYGHFDLALDGAALATVADFLEQAGRDRNRRAAAAVTAPPRSPRSPAGRP